MAAHFEEFVSRGQKCETFYPHGLARRISHHNIPAHARKRLSKLPRKAVCSALSSSVRRALLVKAQREQRWFEQ